MEERKQFKLSKKFYDNQEAQQIEQQIKNNICNTPGVNCFRGKDNKVAVFFNSEDHPFYLKLQEWGFRKPIQQQQQQLPIQSKKQRLVSKNINKQLYKRNQNILNHCNVTNLSISSSSSSSKKSKKNGQRNDDDGQLIEEEEEQKSTNKSESCKQQQKKLQRLLVDLIQTISNQQLTYSQVYKLLLQQDEKGSTNFADIAFNEKQYVTEFLSQEIKDREMTQKLLLFNQQNQSCLNCSQNHIIASSQSIQSSSNKIPTNNNKNINPPSNNNSFFENLECFDSTKNQTMINQSTSNKVSIQKEIVSSIPIQKDFNYSQHSNCSINDLFNKKAIIQKEIRHTKGSALLKKNNVIKKISSSTSQKKLLRQQQQQQQQQMAILQPPPDYKKQVQQIFKDIDKLENGGDQNKSCLKMIVTTTTTPLSNSFDRNSNNFLEQQQKQKIDQVEQIEQEMPNVTTRSKLRQLNSLFTENDEQ